MITYLLMISLGSISLPANRLSPGIFILDPAIKSQDDSSRILRFTL